MSELPTTIFVLTVMGFDAEGMKIKDRFRTWGWFPTLDLAEQTIRNNDADIYEDGYYNIVVVEEMTWGSLALAEAEHWYSAVAKCDAEGCVESYDVTKIDKPKSVEGIVNFGMG